MTKAQKDLDKLRKNPRHVRYEDLVTILTRLGFEKRQDSTSHVRFTYQSHILVIPKRKPFLKPIYIAQVLKLLDQILDDDNQKGS
jgi:predicted RNA binding protein YcfA (HicA-like mRNA interferase family)